MARRNGNEKSTRGVQISEILLSPVELRLPRLGLVFCWKHAQFESIRNNSSEMTAKTQSLRGHFFSDRSLALVLLPPPGSQLGERILEIPSVVVPPTDAPHIHTYLLRVS